MPNLTRVARALLLLTASLVNIGAAAVLGFVLAGVLTPEDFGVTRVVSAYMIVLGMLGTFTLNDALASHLARTGDPRRHGRLFAGASLLVAVFSCAVSALFIVSISGFAVYQPELRQSLIWVAASAPFLCLSLVYTSSLQAVESHVAYALITLLNGLLPLLVILPFSMTLGLAGWSLGRVVTSVLIFVVCGAVVLRLLRSGVGLSALSGLRQEVLSLWRYARVQILSGVLSLVLLSADVVLLEWLTSDLPEVANYGLALLFTKAFIVVSSTLGKLHFKELAMVVPRSPGVSVLWRYLGVNQALALVSLGLLLAAGPVFIKAIYGDKYALAESLLLPMSLGLFFYFFWNALSVVNVSLARTRESFLMSLAGAVAGIILLLWLVPRSSALGAVWAMNVAYAAGATVGVVSLIRSGYLARS